MHDLISVIVPFYNRIPEVIRALISIKEQSYPCVEVIVINDGSSDDASPVRTYCAAQCKWVYIDCGCNEGVSVARNIGLERASGDWIAFLDSDDWWAPDKLSSQLEFMIANNCSASHTSYIRHDSRGATTLSSYIDSGKFDYSYPRVVFTCRIATPTVMVKSSVIKRLKFNSELSFMEDHDLWIRIGLTDQIYGLNKALTFVDFNSRSGALDLEKYLIGMRNLRNSYFGHNRVLRLFHAAYGSIVYLARKTIWFR